jgi:squalene synthase HpnC
MNKERAPGSYRYFLMTSWLVIIRKGFSFAYDFLVSKAGMAVDHYENFPVASLLMPAALRPAVKAIYAFARSADDIADEGDATPAARLAALDAYDLALQRIETGGTTSSALFRDLQQVIRQYALPYTPFRDLLSAFRQDVTTVRYPDFASLQDYCRRSADPVGILMLHLYGAATPDNLRDAASICTALQLINFWQDVGIDWRKQRIYLPLDDMERHGVTPDHIAEGRCDAAWRALMGFEVARARRMMLAGAPLALRLPGRIGWELRLVVQGGLRILDRIEAAGHDVFRRRPRLGPADWAAMGWRALRMPAA